MPCSFRERQKKTFCNVMHVIFGLPVIFSYHLEICTIIDLQRYQMFFVFCFDHFFYAS